MHLATVTATTQGHNAVKYTLHLLIYSTYKKQVYHAHAASRVEATDGRLVKSRNLSDMKCTVMIWRS